MIISGIDEVAKIAKNARNVAIVGISKNRERASYQIANKIKDRYNLYLVNPRYAGERLFGIEIIDSLLKIEESIDIVDVFRNPNFIEEIIRDAIEIGARVVWLQPGSENMEVIERYKDKIDIIYNSCLGVVAGMVDDIT